MKVLIAVFVYLDEPFSDGFRRTTYEKDIFNDNIRDVKQAYVVLVLELFTFFLCAAVLISIGVFYDDFEEGARELVIVLGILSLISSIAFPVATILFTRKYPKHKRICHLLLMPYLFNDKSK